MRYLCLFLLLNFYSIIVNAQHFNAGVLVGLSTSQVDGDNLAGFNKAGIKVGGFVNRKLGERCSLAFELEFIQKGSRKPLNQDDNTYYLMRLNYLEVPLLLNYQVGGKLKFEAGPSFAALISSYEEDQNGELKGAVEFNKFDYLINVGATYNISEHWFANARFSYSLGPIRKFTQGYVYSYYKNGQYNQVLAFTLGYQF